jgi:menaquinone-dependent protoporphyrinogen oxidase
MKLLIVYGTTEGHTRKVARFIEDYLQDKGHAVSISDATDEPPPPNGFDAAILAGSVHMQKYQGALGHYAKAYSTELNAMPSALLSVSLGVASGDEGLMHEAMLNATTFVHDAGWTPHRILLVAGALKYLEYDFLKRMIMRMIAKKEGRDTDTTKDYEYTDWEALRGFCDEFVANHARKAPLT